MTPAERAAYLAAADRLYASDTLQVLFSDQTMISDAPNVAQPGGGAWVQAWVWVPASDTTKGETP